MTDREMVELAAKASGLKIEYMHEIHPIAFLQHDQNWPRTMFNPLFDDGDALRLSLSLGIQTGDPHQYGIALACTDGRLPFAEYWEEIIGGDYLAATRRAIVRAAAEIGKKMP